MESPMSDQMFSRLLSQDFEDCKWLDVGESYWEIDT